MPANTEIAGSPGVGLPAQPRPLSIADDVTINDELKRSSIGFGELIEQVGAGIVDTTRELTKTGAASISSLANTLIDVTAAEETIYDENGAPTDHQTYSQKLPLINFVDPIIYQWSEVRLQGVFFAQELMARSTTTTSHETPKKGSAADYIPLLFGLPPYGSKGTTTNTETKGSTHATDQSVGTMRMHALLEPRYDVGVPKPTHVTLGPVLAVLQGPVAEEMNGTAVSARTMEAVIEYHRADGQPIAERQLSIEAGGLDWSYKPGANATNAEGNVVTDANGRVTLVLRREFADPKADTARAGFVVSVRKGLVNTSASVQL